MYQDVKAWRRNVRRKLIEGFGSKCAICGIVDDPIIYDIHHVDPTQKDFALTGKIRKWDYLIAEASKCALLCVVCHRKLHAGICELPSEYQKFSAPAKPEIPRDKCPICRSLKRTTQTTCSVKCAAKSREKIDWDAAAKFYQECGKYILVARKFGCSDTAVKKQMRKRGLT